MKKSSRIVFFLSVLVLGRLMLDLSSCVHEDQILDELVTGIGTPYSETELLSAFTNVSPTIDGEIENLWDAAVPLKTRATIPTIAGEKVYQNFFGYSGRSYPVSLRSMYDNENIYFLFEWDDNTLSQDRNTWYFYPLDNRWKQEKQYPIFNEDGVMIREAFYEDKFAVLWNVNKSVSNWDSQTCYASCHTGLDASAGFARHYTNSPEERIDMWHWKSIRDITGTMDDQYQDNTQPNGRKSDPSGGGGPSDNRQTLTITGTNTEVTVPKYWLPNETYYYWIHQDDVNNGTAKLITAVDDQGVLTYEGGTIDPKVDMDFQRAGSRSGAKAIPSVVVSKQLGNRGDILAEYTHTGSGYILEIKRKLDTGDTEKVDINLSDLSDQYFGIGVFENAAYAHAIKPNLLLKFGKK